MSSLKARREQILKEKIKEMGNIGVKERSAAEAPFYDPPVQLSQEEVLTTRSQQSTYLTSDRGFAQYQARYFSPSRFGQGKSGFTISSEVLQMLRDVLRDVQVKTTLTAYIENILIEHLKEHQELLNQTAAQYRRTQTLNL